MKRQSVAFDEIMKFERRYRAALINSLPGIKPLVLIGTSGKGGKSNLAPFNSLVHIGSDPPLLGFVSRPDSVPRHTLQNIRETGLYSINVVPIGLVRLAHQCSARYDINISEFEAVGLELERHEELLQIPFVKECRIQIGMKLRELIAIKSNGTHLVIGQILNIYIPEDYIFEDGSIDHIRAQTAGCIGLDTYVESSLIAKLIYAKP